MRDKVMINCAAGEDDQERATGAFVAASAAAAINKETAMFLSGGAIEFATLDGAAGIKVPGYGPLILFRDALMENGGRLWICPSSAAARGLEAGNFIEGAEIAGVPQVLAFSDRNAVLLM